MGTESSRSREQQRYLGVSLPAIHSGRFPSSPDSAETVGPPWRGGFRVSDESGSYLQRAQARENPYRAPPDGQLHLTAAQQERLKILHEGIAERARKSKQLAQEALAEQRELSELSAQSEKNKEFIFLRERMVDLVGSAEIQIPELFVSLIDTRGEAVDENLVHMTEPDETSTPMLKKKGKTLKSKTARSTKTTPTTAAVPSVEPSQGATAGSPPPAGRIDTLKAARRLQLSLLLSEWTLGWNSEPKFKLVFVLNFGNSYLSMKKE